MPEVLKLLKFILWDIFSTDFKFIRWKYFFVLSVIEILQSSSLAILVFVILPQFDVIEKMIKLTFVSFIPSALGKSFILLSNKDPV